MNHNTQNYRKRVAQFSILSGIVAFASFFFMAAGTAFHFEVFSAPEKILGMNDADSQYLKWSMILDMFGYYLLLLPALFYFKNYLKEKTAWYQLFTWCGSAYILLGSMGAAILSVVCPNLMVAYPVSTEAEQLMMINQYRLILGIVHGGMWNTLEILLAGVWWLGIGNAVRTEKPVLGIISLVLGFCCLLDGAGTMLNMEPMAAIGLNIYLILAIVWAIAFGISLLQQQKNTASKTRTRIKIPDTNRANWIQVN